MQDQRPHYQEVARIRGHCDLSRCRAHGVDLLDPEPSMSMRSGNDPQRPVFRSTGVKVQAESQHALQDTIRRLNVRRALLRGPRAEAERLLAFPNGDRAVLVPGNVPVMSADLSNSRPRTGKAFGPSTASTTFRIANEPAKAATSGTDSKRFRIA